jgi:rSAM/selenodomain-associated transferase 2
MRPATAPCDLSIVIASLNAAATLGATLASLTEAAQALTTETIVVDGGSTDATPSAAKAAGAAVIESPKGRGRQLAAGAKAARGNWLLFLHADTVLEPFWSSTATNFMSVRSNLLKAGHFKFALDDTARGARRIERLANWRARTFALPYGDQGLLMSRTLYDSVGGFGDMPLMEDVDMVRRIGKSRLVELPATATTSAARYKRGGYVLRPLRNLSILSLYMLGVPPRRLAKLYG